MISIIIPCFNSGFWLSEAINSCICSIYSDFEILIINDGSTDQKTLNILESLIDPRIQVIHQENKGPASARNFGVAQSKGEYLLFLDSDNRVKPDYLKKASDILDYSTDIGVVYSQPSFFGNTRNIQSRFSTKFFSIDGLLAGNFIDMCSMVRRKTFDEVAGFDESRNLIGWEDWDFWIKVSKTSWRFHFLNEVLFEYRVREDSLSGMSGKVKTESMLQYLGSKHGFLIHERYRQYYKLIERIEDKPLTFFIRIIFKKYFLRKTFLQK